MPIERGWKIRNGLERWEAVKNSSLFRGWKYKNKQRRRKKSLHCQNRTCIIFLTPIKKSTHTHTHIHVCFPHGENFFTLKCFHHFPLSSMLWSGSFKVREIWIPEDPRVQNRTGNSRDRAPLNDAKEKVQKVSQKVFLSRELVKEAVTDIILVYIDSAAFWPIHSHRFKMFIPWQRLHGMADISLNFGLPRFRPCFQWTRPFLGSFSLTKAPIMRTRNTAMVCEIQFCQRPSFHKASREIKGKLGQKLKLVQLAQRVKEQIGKTRGVFDFPTISV